MQNVLAHYPHWDKAAQHMVSEQNSDAIGLVWEAFPDLSNPVHREIWNVFWKKGKIGDGYGAICDYFGSYLVIQSDRDDHGRLVSFYAPRLHAVLNGKENMAFYLYGGDKDATLVNIHNLVEHLLVVNGYKASVVDDCNQIPHREFEKDNPNVPFSDFLGAKGIIISPPRILKKSKGAEYGANKEWSECNVWAYEALGGRVFRYEVQCENGRITDVEKFLIGDDIGDCCYIM